MKPVNVLAIIVFPISLLTGCACNRVSVKVPSHVTQSVPESAVTRGKEDTWRAPVTVENMQGFTEEMFADLRHNFIEPLTKGPYRYAINSMVLAAVPEVDNEWTLLISLDDGAAVRVENFVEWNEGSQSYFTDGLRRVKTGLTRVSKKDPALGRYVAAVTKPKQPGKKELLLAQSETAETPQRRLQD